MIPSNLYGVFMVHTLGRSGLTVSPHGLGTMTWGRETDEHEAAEMLDIFMTSGGNYIDTAPFFGEGRAEHIVGKLAASAGRDNLVIGLHTGVKADEERRVDASRSHLLQSLDASLASMAVECVDVWFVDRFDPRTPVEEILLTLEIAVRSGRTRYIGVGNYSGWQLAEIAAKAAPSLPITASSVEYSLVQRGIEREHLPAARHFGIGVIPWSPLGRGVLTGKYRSGVPADSRAASPLWGRFVQTHLSADARRVVEAVATAASGLGLAPLDIALAWSRGREGTTASLLGARTVGQLRAALTNVDLVLPDEIRAALDDVSALARTYPDPAN